MDTMPITYDIRRDLRYKQGKAEGKAEAEDLAKHLAEQALIKDQSIVIRLLKKEVYSLEAIADIADLSLYFVIQTKLAYEKVVSLLEIKKKSLKDIAKETGLVLSVIEKLKN